MFLYDSKHLDMNEVDRSYSILSVKGGITEIGIKNSRYLGAARGTAQLFSHFSLCVSFQ